MVRNLVAIVVALLLGSAVAYGQFQNTPTLGGIGGPGGANYTVQYNATGTLGGISNGTTGQCLVYATPPVWGSCAAGSQTSIAAGSNITTSGTASNVIVNVVATPTFTTVIASSNITAGSAQFTGAVTAATGNFSGLTVQGLTGCVQAAGLFTTTGVNCATQTSTPSIAAGSNITTSGTSANITVAVVPNPTFTSLTSTIAAFPGWLTATGVNLQTATIVGNLTAQAAQFPGFLTAGGASLSGLTIQTETLSGALLGTTANLSGNLTGTTAQFSGLLTGTTAQLQTMTVGSLGASTQCIESIAGVITGFGSGCGGTATSIAAGTNITTSGTASNITVNVVATPSFTTEILTGNLTGTTAQFSGQVTGTTAVFQTITAQNVTSLAQGLAPNSGGGTTNFLRADATWAQPPGTASPTTITIGGSNTQLQYNANGNLGANSGLTAGTTGTLAAGIYTGTPTGAGALSFFSPSIAGLALAGTATPSAGWINWGGEARLTTTRTLFNAATLTPTVLSVNLQGGRSYSVEADLYFNTAAGVSGIQASLTGTYGSTATNYFGYVVDGGTVVGTFGTLNPVRGAAISAAKNGVVGNTLLSGTTGYLKITGTVSASTSGTLVVAAGQNAAGTTSTTLTIGSRLIVQDMP